MQNKNVLIFGKDQENVAQPIEMTGAEGRELKIMSNKLHLFTNILNELKKFNMQLSLINDYEIPQAEVDAYKKKI